MSRQLLIQYKFLNEQEEMRKKKCARGRNRVRESKYICLVTLLGQADSARCQTAPNASGLAQSRYRLRLRGTPVFLGPLRFSAILDFLLFLPNI